MKILLTNDDGIDSPYLRILCEALCLEHDVLLVAPEQEQSGIGQAISIYRSLNCREVEGFPCSARRLNGSPSDCVKFAVSHLRKDDPFDLVVSGVNPGENAGLSSLYSGTVAAAREAATWGLPAISLSVWRGSDEAATWAARWLLALLRQPQLLQIPSGAFWNVNFPDIPPSKVQGVKVCSMSSAMYRDHYLEQPTPRGYPEYWLVGEKPVERFLAGTDDQRLHEKFITITPLSIDQTSAAELSRLGPLEADLARLR